HGDHRFEWTRAEFREWAGRVAGRHGYEVAYVPVGPDDPEVGPPTQMAVFSLTDTAPSGTANRTDVNSTEENNRAEKEAKDG
ncbi:3' terminal RNA ribose 2'-O-methyltransferase Hen1, partial [Streptomyces sp. NPDC059524]